MALEVDTSYVTYTLRRDGILEAMYKPGVFVDEEVARVVVSERLAVQSGRSYFVMVGASGNIFMDGAARAYLTGPEGTKGIHAAAFLAQTNIAAIIGKLIIVINRPQTPAKLFVNRRKAIGWLRQRRLRMDGPARGVETTLDQQETFTDNPSFEHIFNQSNYMQIVLGPSEHVLDLNTFACDRLGYDKDAMRGMPFYTITDGTSVLYDSRRRPVRVEMERTDLPSTRGEWSDTLVVARESLKVARNGAPAVRKDVLSPALRFANAAIISYNINIRELTVLGLLSQGLSKNEIAEYMEWSPLTVSAVLSIFRNKMGVRNDAALVQIGNDLDLIGDY